MRLPVVRNLVLAVLAVVGMASRAEAGVIYVVPPGLSPGATYRLAFVTGVAIDATSSNIADYNALVTAQADSVTALLNLGATWTAIGSTPTVSAVTNAGAYGSSAPIYGLDGNLVASNTAALFNPSYGGRGYIDVDQNGVGHEEEVWTGSNPDGSIPTSPSTYALGGNDPWYGYTIGGGSLWINWNYGLPADTDLPVYAISSVLTVGGTAVPEPTTIGLSALGGAMLLLAGRRRQKSRRAS